MRPGIVSWNPLAKLAVWTGWLPTPLLTGYWGMMSSRALIAAVELGVFELLAEKPRTAADLALELGTDPVGTEALLNALNGFGHLRRRAGIYRNGLSVRRWLTTGGTMQLDGTFGLFRVLWDELDDLEGRLRENTPRDFHSDRTPQFWARYQTGLAQFARLASAEIARKVPIDGKPLRLLDIGGGHAMYSARFCMRYPELDARVIDLPGAVEIGRQLVAREGLGDRIAFAEGDLETTDWGDGYDIVLLFNVVHIFSPEQCVELFSKARAALRPGGTFVVLDSAHRGGAGDIDAAGGANELLFWTINNTRAYPEHDIADWMHATGFSAVRVRHLLTVPQAALTTGRA